MAGGLGPAYGQTDVMHDRSYLIRQLASRHRADREQARAALDNLNRQEALQQRDIALEQRDYAIQQRQLNFEANQRRIMAHQNALEMDKQLKIDRDTEIDEQGHRLLLSMMQLEAQKRRGEIDEPKFQEGILAAVAQNHLGLRHPEAKKHYEFVTEEFDKQNAFNTRRELTQAAKIGAKYGIEPQIDPETGRPSIQLTQQAALQTPKGQTEAIGQLNTEMAHKYGVTTGVRSLFNPIAPHVGTDASGNQVENPTHIKVPFMNKEGKEGSVPVPKPLFDQMKSDFQDRYFALGQPTAARTIANIQQSPTPTPEPSPTPDTRPVPGFNIPILDNTAATAAPISTPSPSPEATATPVQAPTHLGTYNPATGEFE